MNFKFNRKPLKEKIYKWYVCGYYDINARGVEDNLTTNDVEEAKDFAWELVNRGDFVIVKNMHNGKSAIINEDDVFDDVSEYLNDIFRSIDGRRTNESLKEERIPASKFDKSNYNKEFSWDSWGDGKYRVLYKPKDGTGGVEADVCADWKHKGRYELVKIEGHRINGANNKTRGEVQSYIRDYYKSMQDMGESLKEDTVKQNNGKYNRVVKKFNSLEDARGFESKLPKEAEARIDYFDTENKDGSVSEWWEVCYWENRLKEDISDYEIDKVYKRLSKLNKVNFGALEDEFLRTRPSLKDAVYKFYGTILNTKSYCKDFVKWAKEEKGIDLKGLPCKESYRRR